jgi:hypothetical protein
MSRSLAVTTAAYGLGVTGWIALRSLRGRNRAEGQSAALAVLQGALLLQALLVGAAWLSGSGPVEPYLALSLLLLPAGWLVCQHDARPWSTARLAVATMGVAAIALRMSETWGAGGA